jgi:DNA modification methylase
MTPYYADDFVTIYHGDCRDVGIDLDGPALVTDPPYGLNDLMDRPGDGKWQKLWSGGAPSWDREAPTFLVELASSRHQAIIWGGNYFPLPPSRGWLVWDKIVREFSSGHCELAWTNLDQPVRAFNYSHGQLASEGKYHPTQKPLPLMRWCVGMTTGTILDPFMGSGTTLVAAKSLGRRAIGIEIEERYCEIAAQRCSQEVLGLVG